jgi:uncharacterized surface protein with fasciclin (FAS1) repeats/plastocyanin
MKKNIFFILLLFSIISYAQTTHYINAGMMYFTPSSLTIEQGDIVIWINDGGMHDVNGDINTLTGESFGNPESFDSEVMSTVGGEIYTHIFNVPGLYNYDCSVYGHASSGMVGSINVNSLEICEDDNETITSIFGDMFINDCPSLISFLMNSYNYTESQSCEWDGNPMFDFNGMIILDYCECACQSDEESYTVVDVIIDSENHTILEAAVIAAELVDDLSTDGPFTVFAPTDDAFNALPEGAVDELLVNPTGLLAEILLHHVASESVLSTDLSDGMAVTTLLGTELTVSISDDGVMIDNAMVTVANIMADNGVVHVINAVLIPSEEESCVDDDFIIDSAFNTLSTCQETIDFLMNSYGYTASQACAWDGDMGSGSLFGGQVMSDFCECSCDLGDNTSVQENIPSKEIIFTKDFLGRNIIVPSFNTPYFIIYKDGTYKKLLITNI